MNPVFKIDNVSYNVRIPDGGLKRSSSVLDGENAGRTKSGRMIRDIIGTYFNYTLQIETKGLDVAQYDALYEALTAPVDYHTITVPYGQGSLTFQAYISNSEDVLVTMENNRNTWGGLSISFIAIAPARTP